MKLSSIFLKEFTRQILTEISGLEGNQNKNQKLIENLNRNKEITKIPRLSAEIVNEIKNPALAPYLPLTNSEGFIEDNYNSGYYNEDVLMLGKLTPIINDLNIISIECNGSGKFITLKTKRGVINTQITLTNQEIENILDSFSRISMIPRIGGMFKAIAEDLLITSIESPTGNKFIISRAPQTI